MEFQGGAGQWEALPKMWAVEGKEKLSSGSAAATARAERGFSERLLQALGTGSSPLQADQWRELLGDLHELSGKLFPTSHLGSSG